MANRFLNNITINDQYTFPSTDGSAGQAIITDGAGNLTFGSATAASADSTESVHISVKNTSGATITKGTPVYVTGETGNSGKIEIAPADASDSAKMPALGILESDLTNNSEGFCVQGGLLEGLATATIDGTSTTANDTVYIKAGGGLTMIKPTGTNFIQNIAKVARVHASNGSLVVSSILRTNDVPTPLYIDHANQRVGIGEETPLADLHISKDSTGPELRIAHEPASGFGGGGLIRFQGGSSDYVYGGIDWYNGANRDGQIVYAAAGRTMNFRTNERGISASGGFFRFYEHDTEIAEINLNGIYGNAFYDQGNTAYYVNPADSSNIKTLNVETINRNPVVTLSGDVTGSATMTNLGSINIATTVANNSHQHDVLYENSTITYGASHLQWMDINGNGGTGLNGSNPQNPTNDWHYHLLMNHGNSLGYYVDLAFDFHDDNVWFQRNEAGTLQGWRQMFHDGYHPNADTWTTARTITIGNTGKSVNGSANVSWSLSEIGAASSSHTHTWANISGETANSVNGWGGLRHQTNDGYIDFGPANTNHAHIYTDRPNFYLNAPITVNGSSIINTDDIRSAIFYDLNDTNYYGNFASNSRYNTAQGNYLGLGVASNTSGSYRLNMGGSIDMNSNDVNFVNQLHFQDDVRFYDDGNDSYLNFKYGDSNSGGIRFRRGDYTQKGYLFASDEGFGLLDSDGMWAVRTQTGTSPLELRCDNNTEFQVYNSYTLSPGSSRAPIFYDSNNTGYFFNGDASKDGVDLITGSNYAVNVLGTISGGHRKHGNLETPEMQWSVGGSTDLNWKKLCDVVISDANYSGWGAEIEITDFSGNYGNAAYNNGELFKGALSIYHWGGSGDNTEIAYANIPYEMRNNVRWYKVNETGQNRYQLQVKSPANFRQLYIKVKPGIGNHVADIISYANDTNGLTSGGTAYASTQYNNFNHEFAGGIWTNSERSIGWKNAFGSPSFTNYYGAITTNTTLYVGGSSSTQDLYCDEVRSNSVLDKSNSAYYFDGGSTGDSIRVAGDVVAYYSSDERLKDNIKPIENALEKVNAISGVTFEWNEKSHKTTGKKDVGVVAQEIEAVLPELVETRTNGYKAVDYQKLTAVLIESVKELTAKVEALESKQCNCK